MYRSAELERLWPLGMSSVGSVTFESAAYVARYVTKKVTGEGAERHYERLNPLTGELVRVASEYATMSRRPGIGRGWIEQFGDEVYPADSVVARGKESRPPRFYDKVLEAVEPVMALEVKLERARELRLEDQTEERLVVREACVKGRLNLFGGGDL